MLLIDILKFSYDLFTIFFKCAKMKEVSENNIKALLNQIISKNRRKKLSKYII